MAYQEIECHIRLVEDDEGMVTIDLAVVYITKIDCWTVCLLTIDKDTEQDLFLRNNLII